MNRIITLQDELDTFRPKTKQPLSGSSRYSISKTRYSLSKTPAAVPGIFGIAGLTGVEAANLGLGAVGLVGSVPTKSGNLSISSDKAERLLTPQARQKLGAIPKTTYTYPILYISAPRPLVNNADALLEVTWEGNNYGEIGAAYVRRNLKSIASFHKTSLTVAFTKHDRIPPTSMKDPREWPVVFGYDGSYDPWGNGQFEFQGEFEINAFGGLTITRHEVKSVSFIEFAIAGNASAYVQKQSNRSYTVTPLPAPQKKYLLEQIANP
jgi:hypothetical protein